MLLLCDYRESIWIGSQHRVGGVCFCTSLSLSISPNVPGSTRSVCQTGERKKNSLHFSCKVKDSERGTATVLRVPQSNLKKIIVRKAPWEMLSNDICICHVNHCKILTCCITIYFPLNHTLYELLLQLHPPITGDVWYKRWVQLT